jgi:anhydro-N-acetylmuramic acid kinase
MSGTSADGIDAVLISSDGNQDTLLQSHHRPMPVSLRKEILAFRESGQDELHRLATLDRYLADEYAAAVEVLLSSASLDSDAITAIGSHGQTLRHQPQGDAPYTLQIGDPSRLAELTGITVVADFRRRDMAAGGQGAPLVPAFHQAQLVRQGVASGIANIGGIANVTLVSAEGQVQGWDTGPGNTLMDSWVAQHQHTPFDQDGAWASTGTVIEPLLRGFMTDPYFSQPPPKSTGPEYFHLGWLDTHLTGEERPADVQRTLAELTVESLARVLESQNLDVVRICGGGARNPLVLSRLTARLEALDVTTTDAVGVDPEWVEAWAFAWLAKQTLAGLPGNVPAVTGALGARVLGGIYPGKLDREGSAAAAGRGGVRVIHDKARPFKSFRIIHFTAHQILVTHGIDQRRHAIALHYHIVFADGFIKRKSVLKA